MKSWNLSEDEELGERIIWTGTYGFNDSDALGQIWGRTQKYFEKKMRKALLETAEQYRSEKENGKWETRREVMDQLWYVGPYLEYVKDIELEETARMNEFMDDLRISTEGYVY